MIKYYCSDGSRVSEATIKQNLSKAYREKYGDSGHPCCYECSESAQGSAHLIPKARLKQLGLTELIWNPKMFIPACYHHNSVIENVSSEEFRKLRCYDMCLELFREFDTERFQKAL